MGVIILDQFGSPIENQVRRFEPAQTNRLNEAHWNRQQGESLNLDIDTHIRTLRKRASYEFANNAILSGVIGTHVIDVIGKDGPQLRVRGKGGKRYAKILERIWSNFAEEPDVSERYSLVDLLQLWLTQCWTFGEFAYQHSVSDEENVDGLKYRINNINPNRIITPGIGSVLFGGSKNIIMGVEIDEKTGKVLNYHIDNYNTEYSLYRSVSLNTVAVPKRDMVLYFDAMEVDQLRGVPWVTPILQALADLRDMDEQVLDAARAAADFSIMMFSNHDRIKPDNTVGPTSFDIRRRQVTTVPPGWSAQQMDPKHPSSNYIPFREARLSEIGRPKNMPPHLVSLNSSKHNYSSSRADSLRYDNGNKVCAGRLERRVLNPMLKQLEREAQVLGILPPTRPNDLHIEWTWGKPPHTNPVEEGKAYELGLKNQSMSLIEICEMEGRDWKVVLENIAQVNQEMERLGIKKAVAPPKQEGEEDPEVNSDSTGEPGSSSTEGKLDEKK